MQRLALTLAQHSYDICIGEGLFQDGRLVAEQCVGDKILILSNETIGPLYLDSLAASLPKHKVFSYLIADGEKYKSLDTFAKIIDFLVENKFRRNDTLVALGGGVVGDIGGFVAASYQRGMGLIQCPTSLLAQVDSSVGGKTAVNHPAGKNLIGAFYQPRRVIIDTQVLSTLPQREFVSALAEVTKYAMLGEVEIDSILREQKDSVLARAPDCLSRLIYLSCAKKAEIVAQDENEQGMRALLNLGHSFGHALESMTGYQYYLHGEAVAVGIQMAINLSELKGLLSADKATTYRTLLSNLGLPRKVDVKLGVDKVLQSMKLDKKNIGECYRLVLPTDSGCIIVEEDDKKAIGIAVAMQV